MNRIKSQQGITLVALIITIIVLIILAAVTIISVNNMGLVPLAVNGTQNYAIAQENEANLVNGITDLVLGAISNIENGGTGAGGSSSSDDEEPEQPKTPQIKDKVGVKVEENTIMYDEYNNQIVVPAGFKIVEHDGKNVVYNYTKTEDNIPSVQDGIVIEDVEERDGKGNQFVWIPTGVINNKEGDSKGSTTEIKLGRYENFTMTDGTMPIPVEEGNANTNTNSSSVIGSHFHEYGADDDAGISYGNAKAKNLTAFLTSATGKGGYYIARYEASYDGVGTKPLSQPSKGNTGAYDGTNYAPSGSNQKGYLWNNITQKDASDKCKAMYEENDYESDLVNSYAWDTAIVFIQAYSGKTNYSQQNALNPKSYEEAPDDTGERTETDTTDKVCNIYDMASNCWEWTTETSTYDSDPCVVRGGGYGYSYDCTGYRNHYGSTGAGRLTSFRPLLYVTQ